jgi:CDP-Glycerol:Poly(glycerophosphate) glycerophosphotransferase
VSATAGEPKASPRDVWLVLTGRQALRAFVETGIVDGLRRELGSELVPVLLLDESAIPAWRPRLGERIIVRRQLTPAPSSRPTRAVAWLDRLLDRQLGFWPLAVRLNLRHGFHADRMKPGHVYGFLNTNLVGRLPRRQPVEAVMRRWFFSPHRPVPGELERRMRTECRALVVTNLSLPRVVPFLTAARRLDVPVVDYLLSWDHAVGKGVISPYLRRYLVQNDAMREDLLRYHGIDGDRVVVTGWPQSDVYARRRPREDYEAVLRECGLDPSRPVVLFVANWWTNAPYEGELVARLVDWWEASGAAGRWSLLIRPHPRDTESHERFAAAAGRSWAHVQDASYGDFETLVTLLQHVDCVVVNAGTTMLDAIVNDRPVVCVLYDEGAPPGEMWAAKNMAGEHYRVLAASDAFYRATRFDEVVAGIESALARPDELAAERRRVAREVVGEVDGHAADRVVAAIVEAVGRAGTE